jgi:hypothetical protein
MSSKKGLAIDEGRILNQARFEPWMEIQESIEVRYLQAGDTLSFENLLTAAGEQRTVHDF